MWISFVEYRILEPVKYLYNSEEPEDILKNISQSCIRTVIASYDVDEVLTTGKGEIQSKIKEMILKQMEEQDLGDSACEYHNPGFRTAHTGGYESI